MSNWRDWVQVFRVSAAVLCMDAAMWLCPENTEERILLGLYYLQVRGGLKRSES